MNGNLKKLLNHTDEVATFGLSSATRRAGAAILVKVKAQDAVRLDGAGLSPELTQFGSRALFDFVAIDHERTPLFVMQFESTSHMTDLPTAKEQHENELCRKLPLTLVRLHSSHLTKKHLSSDVVAMLLETFLVAKGIIPASAAADKPRGTRNLDPDTSATGPLSMLTSGPLSTSAPVQRRSHRCLPCRRPWRLPNEVRCRPSSPMFARASAASTNPANVAAPSRHRSWAST